MVLRPLHLLTIGVLVVAGTFAFPARTSAGGAPYPVPNVPQIWQNRQTGYCLGVAGGRMVSGTPVVVWPCNGSPDQEWITVHNPDPTLRGAPVQSGWRQMRNVADQTKCLSVAANSQQDGARMIIWPCLSFMSYPSYTWTGQEFWFDPGQLPGYGFYTMRAQTGWGSKCVGVSGASSAKGASVVQWACLPTHGDQEWYPSAA